jgi:CBS domain-containing protein
MHAELSDIHDFLTQHPPFSLLPSQVLQSLPTQLKVRYFRRGSQFPPQDESPTQFLYLVRTGAIEWRDQQGHILDKSAEGDITPTPCQPMSTLQILGITVEDSLIYLLPCEFVARLRQAHADFATYFETSISQRLRQALEHIRNDAPNTSLLTVKVQDLMSGSLVQASPELSIEAAARLMRDGRCSSLVLTEHDRLVGLVTLRDLRDRCLAVGLSPQQPVRLIMTEQLHTTTADVLAFQTLILMSRLNVHHLPVLQDDHVIGVISTSDLIRFQSANAVYLVSDIHKATSLATLSAIGTKISELQIHLMHAGATADQVGQAITAVTDAIVQRLLDLAEAQLGSPPQPYAWLAGGSQARREQSVHSDQDHALLLAEPPDAEAAHYFEALADQVTAGLVACGFPRCPGDVMASNPQWRQPFTVWNDYFCAWIDRPHPQALLNSSVFFDLRPVRDPENLFTALQQKILSKTRVNRIFIAYMAANAVRHRPPLGFFRHFVLIQDGLHDHTFDLKLRGIVPIIDMARVHALALGITEVNSIERLQAAAGSHVLSTDGAANLLDALEFIGTLRIRHQVEQLQRGELADNFLAPEALSRLERKHLKDAFSLIADLQDNLAQRHQAGRFN